MRKISLAVFLSTVLFLFATPIVFASPGSSDGNREENRVEFRVDNRVDDDGDEDEDFRREIRVRNEFRADDEDVRREVRIEVRNENGMNDMHGLTAEESHLLNMFLMGH